MRSQHPANILLKITMNMNIHSLLQIDWLLQVTPGRLFSIVAGVVGLISIVIGAIALSRSSRNIGAGRLGILAMVIGLIGVVIAGIHLASTTGGFGTGKGRAGAIVAAIIGLIGVLLGGLALSRSSRNFSQRPQGKPQ
jgi:hypothetical protein